MTPAKENPALPKFQTSLHSAKGCLVDIVHLDFHYVFEEFSKPQPKMKNLTCISML